ncbi:hypothetical protein VNO77_20068 [Canavalia gladiata]|uniref:Uncharacterized protein n=1 Tax=Canavalia gladiata TaxID=3824 RepID=A0AAN9LNW4_CANGL
MLNSSVEYWLDSWKRGEAPVKQERIEAVLCGVRKNKQWSPKIDTPTGEETLHHSEPIRSDQGVLWGGPAGSGELKLKKKPRPSSSVALDSGHPITSWRRTRRPILVLGILDCTTG